MLADGFVYSVMVWSLCRLVAMCRLLRAGHYKLVTVGRLAMSRCGLIAVVRLLWVCRCGSVAVGSLWVGRLVSVTVGRAMGRCESVAMGCLLWVGRCGLWLWVGLIVGKHISKKGEKFGGKHGCMGAWVRGH